MEFEPLTILTFTPQDSDEPQKLLVFGATHGHRTDGTSSLMIGQAYSALSDIPDGTILFDKVGAKWILRQDAQSGIQMRYIILEEEEAYARTLE